MLRERVKKKRKKKKKKIKNTTKKKNDEKKKKKKEKKRKTNQKKKKRNQSENKTKQKKKKKKKKKKNLFECSRTVSWWKGFRRGEGAISMYLPLLRFQPRRLPKKNVYIYMTLYLTYIFNINLFNLRSRGHLDVPSPRTSLLYCLPVACPSLSGDPDVNANTNTSVVSSEIIHKSVDKHDSFVDTTLIIPSSPGSPNFWKIVGKVKLCFGIIFWRFPYFRMSTSIGISVKKKKKIINDFSRSRREGINKHKCCVVWKHFSWVSELFRIDASYLNFKAFVHPPKKASRDVPFSPFSVVRTVFVWTSFDTSIFWFNGKS